MRAVWTLLAIVVVVLIAAIAFRLIDIDQVRGGSLPSVTVRGGEAPSYDVKTATVEMGTRQADVQVPKVEVGTVNKSVEVPTVNVKKPE